MKSDMSFETHNRDLNEKNNFQDVYWRMITSKMREEFEETYDKYHIEFREEKEQDMNASGIFDHAIIENDM